MGPFESPIGIYSSDRMNAKTPVTPTISLLIVAFATAFCLLPFVTKDFHVDDPLFIRAAQQIQKAPADPYGFAINWYKSARPMSTVTKNPPGNSYFIAAVASVFGYGELALHLAFILPAMFAIAGTYLLGKWYCRNATLAALMTLFTPVFLVSATTIMCDVLMLALWVFSVYFWLRAVEENSHRFYFVASLLIPACALTKYFGISLLPLLLSYTAWKTRRPGLWLLHFIVPVAVLVWYQTATRGLYGHGLLVDAAAYVTEIPTTLTTWSVPRVLVGLSFCGGCVATILCFSRRLFSRLQIGAALAVAVALAGVIAASSRFGGSALPADRAARVLIGAQFGLLVLGGVGLGVVSVFDFVRTKTAESLLLSLWVGGTFLFATFVNWTMNGRSLLPMVPAASFLIVRRLENRSTSESRASWARVAVPLGAAALLALTVAWGDFKLANVSGAAAARIHEKYPSRNLWFEGHWGFQYYIERYGARAIDIHEDQLLRRDVVVVPESNTNIFKLPSEWAREIDRFHFPVESPLSTMNIRGGAGFYSELFGILPFTLNPLPPETYVVYEVY